MREAVLFPGQGAQFPAMGRTWADAFPTARQVFERADAALGFELSAVLLNENEDIHRTDLAQPGILTTSVAVIEVLRERGESFTDVPLTAGLSLGEYTALWFAGALSFEDAVRLVRLRGEAMQTASDECPSSMTSLMGADEATASALAEIGSAAGICAVANLNAPGQVVISGELAALDAVEAAAPEHGIRRAVRLQVAGGFHSECMRPAADRLAAALSEVEVLEPRIPVVSNVTALSGARPDEIKELLARQVCSPVLWSKSMQAALGQGIDRFLEPAPGTVLGGLMRRIAKEAGAAYELRSIETPGELP